MHRKDGPRIGPDGGLHRIRAHKTGCSVHIHEDRLVSRRRDGSPGGDEGMAGSDHLAHAVAGSEAFLQCQFQRLGAIAHQRRMAAAAPLGEFLAKSLVVGTANETHLRQTAGHGVIEFLFVGLVLSLQINQRNFVHSRPRRTLRVLEEIEISRPVSVDS